MRYVAAYLLAALGGKANPSAADIEKILSSVGIEVDSAKLSKVIEQLKGKNLEELIAQGKIAFHMK
jgi:large subunit ribosomal protein LP2